MGASSPFASLFNRTGVKALSRVFGVSVRLVGDTDSSHVFTARRRDTISSSFDGLDIGGRGTSIVWILPRSMCVLNSVVVKPQAGWTIQELDLNGVVIDTWEIVALDDVTPAVEPDHNDHDWIVSTRRQSG